MTMLAVDTGFTELPDRLVVAPSWGAFVARPPATVTADGELVSAGEVLGEIQSAQGAEPVLAPCDAWVMAVLVRPGERVRPGRPLVHLRAV